ncbi:MAG TPA: alpha/beta fold hydrolase, partial [Polyangia bacterium]
MGRTTTSASRNVRRPAVRKAAGLWPRSLLPGLIALGAVACDGSAIDLPEPPPVADLRFQSRPCTERGEGPGLTTTCGIVALPERYEDPGGGNVVIRVAMMAGGPAAAEQPPVVLLDGPAGGSGIASAIYQAAWAVERPLQKLLANHNVLAIDLRGTGASEPRLACEGLRLEPLSPPPADRFEFTGSPITRCVQALGEQGVTLAAYGTRTAAVDVAQVVRALGFKRFHLVGSGYGARVALELLRVAPGGVEAVVLDSLTPPDVDALLEEGASFEAALNAVYALCAADPACQAVAPELPTALPTVVRRLAASPVDLSTHGGLVTLNGRSFLQAVQSTLRDGGSPDVLIRQLERARVGDYGYFAAVLGSPRQASSLPVNLTVMCAEQMAFTSPEAIEMRAAAQAAPFADALLARYYAVACPLWPVGRSSTQLREPVSSPLPTLLLHGRLDPVTPGYWMRTAQRTLGGGRTLELPQEGHAVLRRPCGATLAAKFLQQPRMPL